MMKIREQNSGFKRFIAVIVISSLLCSVMYAAAPTDISKYSTSGIVKQNGDDHNTMNIPCTYLAYKTGSCSSSTYVCLIVVSPSGVRKSLSAASNMGQYYFGNSSCWIYNKSVTSGSYRFFDLQAVEKGVWRLVFMQTNAGSWYYTQSGMTSKISFDANGGIIPSDGNMGTDTHATLSSDRRSGTVSVTYGSSNFSKMNDDVPVRDGYVFTGWWTSATGGTQVYDHVGLCVFGGYWKSDCTWLKTTDVTLYAQWREASYISDGLLTAGYFSVGEHKYVQFSQGNLQYSTMSTHDCADGTTQKGTWRFAEHQNDTIIINNINISSTYTGWISLFGWGTSGWNSGVAAYQPWSTSTTLTDYLEKALVDVNRYADWGVYNAISNGGNQPGMWRVMSIREWRFLLETRPRALQLRGSAQVEGVPGIILLPDNSEVPAGFVSNTNQYTDNIITASDWTQLEMQGAVFLPVTGYRNKMSVLNGDSSAWYMSSDLWMDEEAGILRNYLLSFNTNTYAYALDENHNRCFGRAVRLVRDYYRETHVLKVQSSDAARGIAQIAPADTLYDCQGYPYPTTTIGNHVWMAENLRATRYDSESLMAGQELVELERLPGVATYKPYYRNPVHAFTYGAWVEYSKQSNIAESQKEHLGMMYNYAAFMALKDSVTSINYMDYLKVSQGVCPNGYHVPDTLEWNEMRDYVVEPSKLKATEGWGDGVLATDDFGFSAIPMGYGNRGFRYIGVQVGMQLRTRRSGAGISNENGVLTSLIEIDEREKRHTGTLRCLRDSIQLAGTFLSGSLATLTATPATGSHFLKWSDGNTENPRVITVSEDVTYTAIFVSDTPEFTLEIYQDCDLNIPVGALSGKFTVSETKQVYFAQGNLQYNAVQGTHACADGSTQPGTWRFAEHQYDYVGDANANIAADYDGWIDMFGWGTSGWNNMNPYMSNKNDPEYCTGENDIEGTFYDWGVYNPIENGGNQVGMWRTLTKDEWEYLIQGRHNATSLFTMASVNGSNGYIILPDNWSDVPGITLNIGIGVIGRDATSYSAMNNISIAQWNQLEKSGAIFLPASGDRSGTDLLYPEVDGGYWSTISVSAGTAFCLDFSSNAIALYSNHRYYGRSVRLVQDVK